MKSRLRLLNRPLLFIASLLLLGLSPLSSAPGSFREAKKELIRIYQDTRRTFYCSCPFEQKQVKGKMRLVILPESCGYQARKNSERGSKVEWEHVVPASFFGASLPCWREGHASCNKAGRSCCRKVDAKFRKMEADMHNIRPAVGELNGDRNNFEYGLIPGEERVYGECDFEVDFKKRIAEPSPGIRGDIARTYFYMNMEYGMPLSDSRKRLLQKWHFEDPPDAQELRIYRRVSKIQGTKNPYLEMDSNQTEGAVP